MVLLLLLLVALQKDQKCTVRVILAGFLSIGTSVIAELEQRIELRATLPTKDVHDYVLALRLSRWPNSVTNCIRNQLSEDTFESIKGTEAL